MKIIESISSDLLSSVHGGSDPLAMPGILPDGQFLTILGGTKKHPLNMRYQIVDGSGNAIGKPFPVGDD